MKRFVCLVCCVLVVACSSSGAAPPQPAQATSASYSDLKHVVHWMRNSAEFQAIVLQTYFLAGRELRRVVEGMTPGTWAVALDADETLISNLEYEKELVELGQNSEDELWMAWVARQAAEPLPGALEFLDLVQSLGGHIAVVTNRRERDCSATRANLEAYDIPFDVLLCRTDEGEKEPRWEKVENGTAALGVPPVEIVMWLGDNINDFPDMTQESRFSSPLAFGDFGGRFFILPNPSYGSWEANPFD